LLNSQIRENYLGRVTKARIPSSNAPMPLCDPRRLSASSCLRIRRIERTLDERAAYSCIVLRKGLSDMANIGTFKKSGQKFQGANRASDNEL
jgi:hypothetical protein